MHSARSWPKRRRAGSSRHGRQSCPTRAFCLCSGRCFQTIPICLPAYFEDDPNAAKLGTSFVRKPLYSREGANVALVSAGTTLVEQEGPYGAEGFIRQALAPLPNFSDQYRRARKLAGRSRAVRTVDPRGRESDHRQHLAVFAACDFVKLDQRAEATAFNVCSVEVPRARRRAPTFGRYSPRRSG